MNRGPPSASVDFVKSVKYLIFKVPKTFEILKFSTHYPLEEIALGVAVIPFIWANLRDCTEASCKLS